MTRNDVPDVVARMKDVIVVDVHRSGGVAQGITFDLAPFRFGLNTQSMMSREDHDDLDRAWLWAGFTNDGSVDLPFVNQFNLRGRAASAAVGEGGIELQDHFILAGLDRGAAELVLAHHILNFRREAQEFGQMRNERLRSSPHR